MAHVGVCELCQIHGDLCESHLWLPKFVYKRLRQADARNPNPVQLSADGVYQTSSQQVKYLLCKQCENERFNKLGERWIAKMCLQDNNVTFPLLDLLKVAPQQVIDSYNGVFYTSTLANLDYDAMEYFAASMVWRGQFVSRKSQALSYSLRKYEPQFRKYLLGQARFPSDASLFIFIRYRSNLTQVSHGVHVKRSKMATFYSFSIPGLTFQLALGKDRDRRLDEMSFNLSQLRPILDMSAVDLMTNDMLIAVTKQAQSRGRRSTVKQSSLAPL